jgi:ubiquinone/menaquinone biosynthesis C-methylase UbiE
MRVLALLLWIVCAGCESWTGFGFRAEGDEMARLRATLPLDGKVVADVGAGKGQLTRALAREAGSGGHVFATEIDPARLRRLRDARIPNVTVLEGYASDTGLPASCCDAIVLRRVYHHLTDPTAINAGLLRALRPGGVLAVIDFPPPFFLSRGQFGVPLDNVTAEVKASGFELVRLIDDWPGRGPLASYCALFRKPL